MADNFSFVIVPLDATATKEFQDLIYVAIKENTNEVLEAACIANSPKIYNDQEAKDQIKQKFPDASFEILPGYFWKSELRSFLSTVRCFTIGSKEIFLLPKGDVIDNFDE
ncbi:hypothetical protein NIES2100_36510 [Calothrix sp. NIES-2100]|uniref:hypothetical protein n=1 Tax=Calothrix sp. NIES-2100 TaxID=1954172 RepID=UPI000B5E15FC|nr:hypothetical protein NIES2100_36510 [Calothrix sp. NIES-2100]